MTDPFGPTPRRRSRSSGYSTLAITLAIISILSGLLAVVLAQAEEGASISLNLVTTVVAAVCSLGVAIEALVRRETRAVTALALAALAVVITIVGLVI